MKRVLSRKFSSLIIADPNRLTPDIRSLVNFGSHFKEPVTLLHLADPQLAPSLPKFFDSSFGLKDMKILSLVSDKVQASDYQLTFYAAQKLLEKEKFKRVIMGNTFASKEILPMLSALYKAQAITDIVSFVSNTEFIRPIYAGNANQTIQQKATPAFLGIRLSNIDKFEAPKDSAPPKIEPFSLDLSGFQPKIKITSTKLQKSSRPELPSARVVISGGRAFKSAEDFQKLYKLADKIPNSNVGASRAAVDSGICPNDLQIGQTGKSVAPQLYIAFGISGAIQHIAGMKDSKVIVAINRDAEAPIFKMADYGLVGDVGQVLEEMTNKL